MKLLYCLLLLLLNACSTSTSGSTYNIPTPILSDSDYYPVLQKWHKNIEITSQFQKKIDVNAVFLSEEFRKAYRLRFEKIRGETQIPLGENLPNGFGILVSLSTPESSYENLDNKHLWTLQLNYGDIKLTSLQAQLLEEKPILDPFFPFITNWSREYLLLFELPENSMNKPLPNTVSLLMRSALASIELKWGN